MGKWNARGFLNALNRLYEWADRRGLIDPIPYVEEGYAHYPEMKRLEDAWPAIREECDRLLQRREQITPISAMGGAYTSRGIHTIAWKSFVLIAGKPIPGNCSLAPRTAAVLSAIPDIYVAFFSILEPHQYVRPHWGYYKGLLRYHLAVDIPGDNAGGECWLRINPDPLANDRRDVAAIEQGRRYYWRNGKGVFFDDTRLHDAANGSDAVRVVLWVDVRRRFPWWLDAINRLTLWLALRSGFLDSVRANAALDPHRFMDAS